MKKHLGMGSEPGISRLRQSLSTPAIPRDSETEPADYLLVRAWEELGNSVAEICACVPSYSAIKSTLLLLTRRFLFRHLLPLLPSLNC